MIRHGFFGGILGLLALAILLSAFFHVDEESRANPGENRVSDRAAVIKDDNSVGYPSFMSPHSNPIAIVGDRVFVANTPADTVDVIHRVTRQVVERIKVGIDPVSLAVRPDGKEVWVSNHISDSVSVIDNDPKSPTYLHVVATVQDIDPRLKATRFDEPVGIAFASNAKAYVALSSENTIAVIDVASRQVINRLKINAQDPRAIAVRGDRLYVIPFESNNKTQLSGGNKKDIDGELVTFDAWEHSVRVNNILSLGHVTDIVKHPRVPDRDLYVFDTKTDKLIETVDTLGTLLYGLAVDSKGRVFIAQTDARNEVNGRAGTSRHSLKEMENRAFLNQITRVDTVGTTTKKPNFFNLEPLPPQHPKSGQALATPFAIKVSPDDKTLYASAAGSDKLFTVDAASGEVLGSVGVDAVPRGIALESRRSKTYRAWVLNAVANTVSLVDVSNRSRPKVVNTITLQDPTHPAVKRGRIVFNSASASTTQTFSCASCHPDGHTDQLLWVLKTPIVTGGTQIMPRSTMPIRGLRDTEPFHWDGIPGDPYGGINSASLSAHVEPNSKRNDPVSSARHLIDGGLASTMMMVGDETMNDEGKAGELSAAQRDDLARFLLSVPYPPAQRRPVDNVVSKDAMEGFELFHISGDNDPSKARPNVCGDCHRMPHWVSTNTPGSGMDAPTWRGAYDRFLILPQGRLNIIGLDFYRRVAEEGQDERKIWQFSWGGRSRFDPVWNMVLEGSTGYSGTFARQVTLDEQTVKDDLNLALLEDLETGAREGAVVLELEGVVLQGSDRGSADMRYEVGERGWAYVGQDGRGQSYSSQQLLSLAAAGKFVGTFTARHGPKSDLENPQPALWTLGPIEQQRGKQQFPILHAGKKSMMVSGRYFGNDAKVFVDGRLVSGSVRLEGKERVVITLADLPEAGMHLLQVQAPGGQFSNDFIFFVATDASGAEALRRELYGTGPNQGYAFDDAIARGDLDRVKQMIKLGAQINARKPDGGSIPLSTASLHGRIEIVRYLIQKKANVNGTNQDGNTPLHVAAFLCRGDIVRLLLKNGASVEIKNERGETPVDVVSGGWSRELAEFYTSIGNAIGSEIDLDLIRRERPKMMQMLRESARD